MGEVKAITILQPYASLILAGVKHYETRSWDTPYRGRIAIHSGKGKPYECGAEFYDRASRLLGGREMEELPKGQVIAIATLNEIYRVTSNGQYGTPQEEKWMESGAALNPDGTPKRDKDGHRIGWMEKPMPDEQEQYFGHFGVGFYAWELTDITPLPRPITYRGNQRIWEIPDDLIEAAMSGEGGTP